MRVYGVRSVRCAALVAGLAASLVGCSSQQSQMTGPSGLSGSTGLTGSAGGSGGVFSPLDTPVLKFTATISPSPVLAGSTWEYTVTVTNTGSGSGNSAAILGVNIAVDPDFTNPTGLSGVEGGSVNWAIGFVSGHIHAAAPPSGELDPGEVLVVKFTSTAPNVPCGTSVPYPFTTTANHVRDFTGPSAALDQPSQPTVTVNGPECTVTCIGQKSQGYWKNANSWPVQSLDLGTHSYTKAELLSILNQPVLGNGLVSLAYQLIAAKLNAAALNDSGGINAIIDAADALIDGLIVPPVGSGSLNPSVTDGVKDALEAYNTACED